MNPRARALFLALLALLVRSSATAATVTLEWESNREPDLAGYLVSYGTHAGQLSTTEDAGNHTSYEVTNLEAGRTYFFAVRAYTTTGRVSAPSAELSTTITAAPLALQNFMASLAPPQPAGSTVIFAAAASGGTPPYQYRWSISDGLKWTVVSDWSGENTLTWQPSVANVHYSVKVSARSASAENALDYPTAERSMSFAITSGDAAVVGRYTP